MKNGVRGERREREGHSCEHFNAAHFFKSGPAADGMALRWDGESCEHGSVRSAIEAHSAVQQGPGAHVHVQCRAEELATAR